jgi:hypothetical protein
MFEIFIIFLVKCREQFQPAAGGHALADKINHVKFVGYGLKIDYKRKSRLLVF